MLSNAQASALKPVLNRRVDVLFRDSNPKLDEYCNIIIEHLRPSRGEYDLSSWEDVLNTFRKDTRKVSEIIA